MTQRKRVSPHPVARPVSRKRGGSVVQAMRRTICDHPEASRQEITTLLKRQGYREISDNTLNAMYATTHGVLRTLREQGRLKHTRRA